MCKAPYFIMNDIFKMAKFRFFTFYKLIFIFLLCILTLLRKSSFETSTFIVWAQNRGVFLSVIFFQGIDLGNKNTAQQAIQIHDISLVFQRAFTLSQSYTNFSNCAYKTPEILLNLWISRPGRGLSLYISKAPGDAHAAPP